MTYLSPQSKNSSKPKLFDQVREAVRTRHYSLHTEQVYVQWIQGVK
ncbi:MAG: hypothetical protein ACE5HI_01290 [bacterium]